MINDVKNSEEMIENHVINEKKDHHNTKLGTKDQPKPKMGN